MNPGIIRWNVELAYPKPFSFVQSALKLAAKYIKMNKKCN